VALYATRAQVNHLSKPIKLDVLQALLHKYVHRLSGHDGIARRASL
jgi:hypothetical protein